MSVVTRLLDILIPPLCAGCESEGAYLCTPCLEKIDKFSYFLCPICKRRSPDGSLDSTCRKQSELTRFLGAPLPYANETTRKLIHSLKYNRAKELALPLSQILINFLDSNNFSEVITSRKSRLVIVPVPMYKFRERDRGFNQATEIAKKLSSYYKIELGENVLKKIRNTEPQAEIKNKEQRLVNLSGAFACHDPQKIINKIPLLFDDVYTTGVTIKECAFTLREAGARKIWGITVAR